MKKNIFKVLMADKRLLIQTCLVFALVLVVGIVGAVNITQAWYRTNQELKVEESTVTSSEGDISLFITRGAVTTPEDYSYDIAITGNDFSGNLFPISTPDLTNWYYASSWSAGKVVGFTKATLSQCAETGKTDRYNFTTTVNGASVTRTAYNVATYTVYTNDPGTNYTGMHVYFNPTDSIAVTVSGSAAKSLKQAIRVGIATGTAADNTKLAFVYAPVAESGTGNSNASTSADTFYAVTGTESANVSAVSSSTTTPYKLLTDLSSYSAGGTSGAWTVGTNKLFDTSYSSPVIVKVYVWLEGTDAQAKLNLSDNAGELIVKTNLVGISY